MPAQGHWNQNHRATRSWLTLRVPTQRNARLAPHAPHGEMLAWPDDAPATVREFDWEDDDPRPRRALAIVLTPSLLLAAVTALAVHATVL